RLHHALRRRLLPHRVGAHGLGRRPGLKRPAHETMHAPGSGSPDPGVRAPTPAHSWFYYRNSWRRARRVLVSMVDLVDGRGWGLRRRIRAEVGPWSATARFSWS